MAYNRQYQAGVGWQNEPSVATPINATNLNQMDDAIIAVDAEAARAIGVHDDSIYDLYDRLDDKQDTLVFDDHPILGSSKPVTSDGIFRAIQQGGGGGGGDNFLDEVYIIGLDNQPSLISPALEINTVSRIFDKDKPEYLMFRFGRMAQESGWSGGQTITLNVNNTGDFAVKKNHITQTTDTWSIKGEVLYIACINHSAGPSGNVYYWDFFEVPFDSAGNYEILPITHGGTGNALGYIRTGQKANTTAGTAATAEGSDNTISGNYSHAEGQLNSATGNYTHAGGYYNTAGYPYQTVVGRFNNNQMTTLFEVGNGTGTTDRKNALEVYSTGDVVIDGQLYVGSTIYDMNHNAISAVEANPSGSATTPLSKLKVADTIFSVGGGVSDVAWDATNKKLTKTAGGTTSDIVTGATILNGLTSAQVTTALGYTPPTQDTNTHRPIQVNGSQILGNNTTALNLKAGSNMSITNSSGTVTFTATDTNTHRPIQVNGSQVLGDNTTALNLKAGTNVTLSSSGGDVTISASGGGSGASMSKTRYTVYYSSWSTSQGGGYYTYNLALSTQLNVNYPPNVYISGSGNTTEPSDTQKNMYDLLKVCNLTASNNLVLYAKKKPTSTFYIYVEGLNA